MTGDAASAFAFYSGLFGWTKAGEVEMGPMGTYQLFATVLRELVGCGILAEFPALDGYRPRCEARPAFGRAMEAQMRPLREHAASRPPLV